MWRAEATGSEDRVRMGGWRSGLLALATVVVATGITAWVRLPPARSLSLRARDMRYVANSVPVGGRELFMVFVGASTCGPSNDPELPRAVDSLKVLLRRQAESRGERFAVLGVAKDAHVGPGLSFLERFGPFDEIAIGGTWSNTALARYLFGSQRGPAETPQVVVLERELSRDGRVSAERVVMRKVGLRDIRAWVSSDAALPAR